MGLELNKINTHNTALEKSQNNVAKKAKKSSKKDKKDVFTETPIRKLGILDEAGEALRPVLAVSKNPIISKLPNIAYIPASLYIAADVADKYKKGDDGNGRNGVKMAAREGAYQTITSILAPMGIIKGTRAIFTKIATKLPKSKHISKFAQKATEAIESNKKLPKFMKNATLPVKIAGAAVSLFALSHLIKPVDWATKKVFKNIVDPALGLNKKDTEETKAPEVKKEEKPAEVQKQA